HMAVPPVDPTVPAPLIVTHPINIDGLDKVGPTRAPDVGEHTVEVLTELGYDAVQIERLRAVGAF
ncbi:MAG TPA: hypothetical protein PL082_05035, partial [Tepidiformaceae bacterium]|nr:hypothetical protein [Tepidiformaceae bacterium]